MQLIEFLHKDHFETYYFQKDPDAALSRFIENFRETDFQHLWSQYPEGFAEVLLPDAGFTYLFNLGRPIKINFNGREHLIKSTALIPPRQQKAEIIFAPGSCLFAVRFKITPVLLQKEIDFSEYRDKIVPLAYFIDNAIVEQIRKASCFRERVSIISNYYITIIKEKSATQDAVRIVAEILEQWHRKQSSTSSIKDVAVRYQLSARTLHRYFESITSISGKQVHQLIRIRKALHQWSNNPETFNLKDFGYYDYSHFYKHVNKFFHNFPLGQETSKFILSKN